MTAIAERRDYDHALLPQYHKEDMIIIIYKYACYFVLAAVVLHLNLRLPMKTLIVYYSFTHNNEVLAQELQKQLECDLLKIEDLKKRKGFSIFLDLLFNRKPAIKFDPVTLTDYDRIIFIAPIWAGKIAMPLKTFLTNERAKITHYSFITLCGGGNKNQHNKITQELTSILHASPDAVTELWIHDLLKENQKNSPGSVTNYKITNGDLLMFQHSIHKFISQSETSIIHASSEKSVSWNH